MNLAQIYRVTKLRNFPSNSLLLRDCNGRFASSSTVKAATGPSKEPKTDAAVPGSLFSKVKALTIKTSSRLFQRVITPDRTLERLDDAASHPAADRSVDYVKGRIKQRLMQAVLLRVSRGFAFILPGLGLYFLTRASWSELQRAKEERKRSSKAAFAFLVAAGADIGNLWVTATALAHAVAVHTPMHLPDAHIIKWYGWYAETYMGLPTEFGYG